MVFVVKFFLIPLSIVAIGLGYYYDYKKNKKRKDENN